MYSLRAGEIRWRFIARFPSNTRVAC